MKLSKNTQILLIVAAIVISIAIVPYFFPEGSHSPENAGAKVEIILFHGTSQCISCENVGQWTQEVLQTYYGDEVEQGLITYRDVNAQTNPELVMRYNVRYVSLYINGEMYSEAFEYSDSHDAFVGVLRQKIDAELKEHGT